jgi:hypothetical protein
MNLIDKSKKEIEEYLYYGSNEWMLQFRSCLDRIIEERKSYTHEIYFLICHDPAHPLEHRSMCFTSEPAEILKKSGRSILMVNGEDYKYYHVYLRRFEDNYTVLLATKKEKALIEITIDYLKFVN